MHFLSLQVLVVLGSTKFFITVNTCVCYSEMVDEGAEKSLGFVKAADYYFIVLFCKKCLGLK